MDAENIKRIGQRVRNQRLRAELSQSELASKSGLPLEKITRLEETGAIPLKDMPNIWKVLSTDPFPVWMDALLR